MRSIGMEARQTLAQAQRRLSTSKRERLLQRQFEQAVEVRAQERLESALAERERLQEQQQQSRPNGSSDRKRELLTSLAFLAVGVMGSGFSPAAATRLAPLLVKAPTMLALVGVWRVAQRPIARAADAALRSVKAALQRAGEGLSDFMRRVAGVALAGPAYASSAGGMNAGAL